jgi:hypothetical protein
MTKISANKTTKSTKTEKALSMTPFDRQLRAGILSSTHCDSISGLQAAGGAPRRASRSPAVRRIRSLLFIRTIENVDSDARFFYST